MVKPEDFGTNKDSGQNQEYCCYCFKSGEFTLPGITLDQMINNLVPMASQFGMTEEQAREMASKNLPKLKRWKDK